MSDFFGVLLLILFVFVPVVVLVAAGPLFFRAIVRLLLNQPIPSKRIYISMLLAACSTAILLIPINYFSDLIFKEYSLLVVYILGTIVGIIVHYLAIKWLLQLDFKKTLLFSFIMVIYYVFILVFLYIYFSKCFTVA